MNRTAKEAGVLDGVPFLVWRSGLDAKCDYFNRTWLSFTGRSLEQELGDGWSEGVYPKDLDLCLNSYLTAFHARIPFELRYRLRRHDGQYRWIHDQGLPFNDEAGNFAGYIGGCYEITEQMDALQALRANDELVRAILGSALDCIIAIDHKGKIIEFNKAAESVFGYRADEAIGQPMAELIIPPGIRERHFQAFGTFLATGAAHILNKRVELSAMRRDGSEFPVELTITRIGSQEPPRFTGFIRDISERVRTDRALRESEERLRQVTENIDRIVWLREADHSKFHYVSPAYEKIFGRTCESLYADPFSWREAIHPEDRERILAMVANPKYSTVSDGCYRIVRPDGAVRWVHSRAFPVKDDSGEIVRIAGFAKDVTEQRAAEEELRQSEERFRQVTENIDEVVWLRAADHSKYYYVSPAYEKMFGRSCASLYESPLSWRDTVHPDDGERIAEIESDPTCSTRREITCRIVHPDGAIRWIRSRAFPVRDSKGEVVRVAGVIKDITDRKIAEEALREAHERLQSLSRHQVKAQEEERRRLSRELHDEMGQALTGLKLDVAWLQKCLTNNGEDPSSRLIDKLASMSRAIDQTMERTRQIGSELRPSILDELGLRAAIQWQTEEFEARAGIFCDVLLPETEPTLQSDSATSVFRVFQEVLTNIARHSRATHVVVRLHENDGNAIFEVSDNGRGISESEARQSAGLGLAGMRERAVAVGGTLNVEGSPNNGTTVRFVLPLAQPNGDHQ